MTPSDWEATGVILTVAAGFGRLSYQAGKVREGVKGLYSRIERIEKWIDRRV